MSLRKINEWRNPLGGDQDDVTVGIDQSYSGFAITVLNLNGTYRTEVHELGGKGPERLAEARLIVSKTVSAVQVAKQNIRQVAMEGYAYGANSTAHTMGELGGVVKLALWDHGYLPWIVTPSQLKKWATGNGKASKDVIILHVYKKWSVEFDDNNAADSYALARLATGVAKGEAQKSVLDLVTKVHAAA